MEEYKEEEYKMTKSKKAMKGANKKEAGLIKSFDEGEFSIPKDYGEALERMYFDDPSREEYLYGVYWSMEEHSKIFTNGIEIDPSDSEMFSEAVKKPVVSRRITNVIQLEDWFCRLIYQVKRSRRSCYIVKIPREYIVEKTKPVLRDANSVMRLLPEFIYAAIRKDGNGKATSFIYNPGYRNTHDYSDTGLLTNTDIEKGEYPLPKRKPSLFERLRTVISSKPFNPSNTTHDGKDGHDGPDHPSGPNVFRW